MNTKLLVLMLATSLIAMAPVADADKGGNGGGNGGNGGGNGGGNPPAACNDGADNDGDGQIDYPNDPDCSSASDADESMDVGGCAGVLFPAPLFGPCSVTGQPSPVPSDPVAYAGEWVDFAPVLVDYVVVVALDLVERCVPGPFCSGSGSSI